MCASGVRYSTDLIPKDTGNLRAVRPSHNFPVTASPACRGSHNSSVARKSISTVLNTAGDSSMVMCAVFGMIRIRLLAIPAAICRCQLIGVTRS